MMNLIIYVNIYYCLKKYKKVMVENYEHIYDECFITYIISLCLIMSDIDWSNYDLWVLILALISRWLCLNLIQFSLNIAV